MTSIQILSRMVSTKNVDYPHNIFFNNYANTMEAVEYKEYEPFLNVEFQETDEEMIHALCDDFLALVVEVNETLHFHY